MILFRGSLLIGAHGHDMIFTHNQILCAQYFLKWTAYEGPSCRLLDGQTYHAYCQHGLRAQRVGLHALDHYIFWDRVLILSGIVAVHPPL